MAPSRDNMNPLLSPTTTRTLPLLDEEYQNT